MVARPQHHQRSGEARARQAGSARMGIVLTVLLGVLANRQAGLVAVAALLMPGAARAAEPAQAGVNITAVGMFLVLVTGTLAITWWAARRTRSSGWCRR